MSYGLAGGFFFAVEYDFTSEYDSNCNNVRIIVDRTLSRTTHFL